MKNKTIKYIAMVPIIGMIFTVGCSKKEEFQISYKEPTEEESTLLTLTGNRVFKYNLQNRPENKDYELKLMYEVYEKGKKIKEERIFEMLYELSDEEAPKEKLEDVQLAFNIQDDKIRCLVGGAYSYLDIQEEITNLSYQSFASETDINFGDEIYLFHASSGENGFVASQIGEQSEENKNICIKDNETNIFIKLVYEEVKKEKI